MSAAWRHICIALQAIVGWHAVWASHRGRARSAFRGARQPNATWRCSIRWWAGRLYVPINRRSAIRVTVSIRGKYVRHLWILAFRSGAANRPDLARTDEQAD